MADKEKRGEDRNTKFEYSFLEEIKIVLHNYLRAIIWWENEK